MQRGSQGKRLEKKQLDCFWLTSLYSIVLEYDMQQLGPAVNLAASAHFWLAQHAALTLFS